MSQSNQLRQIFADFARLEERPGMGLSVLLGREDHTPELATLEPGQHVLLIEYGELWAEGVVLPPLDRDGQRYWFASIENRAAIHYIEPSNDSVQNEQHQTATMP